MTETSVLMRMSGSLVSPTAWSSEFRTPLWREDDHPGVGPDEVARPERQHHEDQQQDFAPSAVARHPVRDRIADREAQDRRDRRVPNGVEERRQEDPVEGAAVVVEARGGQVDALERVTLAEADDEESAKGRRSREAPEARSDQVETEAAWAWANGSLRSANRSRPSPSSPGASSRSRSIPLAPISFIGRPRR
jgi:hypothetical protein